MAYSNWHIYRLLTLISVTGLFIGTVAFILVIFILIVAVGMLVTDLTQGVLQTNSDGGGPNTGGGPDPGSAGPDPGGGGPDPVVEGFFSVKYSVRDKADWGFYENTKVMRKEEMGMYN